MTARSAPTPSTPGSSAPTRSAIAREPIEPTAPETPTASEATVRERLARRQAELLSALVEGGPAPEGFDADRLAVEAAALRAKRRRVLRRMLDPAVVDTLGTDLDGHLDRWMRERPRREGTGFHADAAAFTADLRERGLVRRRRWWRHPRPSGA